MHFRWRGRIYCREIARAALERDSVARDSHQQENIPMAGDRWTSSAAEERDDWHIRPAFAHPIRGAASGGWSKSGEGRGALHVYIVSAALRLEERVMRLKWFSQHLPDYINHFGLHDIRGTHWWVTGKWSDGQVLCFSFILCGISRCSSRLHLPLQRT